MSFRKYMLLSAGLLLVAFSMTVAVWYVIQIGLQSSEAPKAVVEAVPK